jgi:hypothetical protein
MHRGTDRRLDTFQIESASRFTVAENDVKQLLYFAGDFFLDRFGRFFSGTSVRSLQLGERDRSSG